MTDTGTVATGVVVTVTGIVETGVTLTGARLTVMAASVTALSEVALPALPPPPQPATITAAETAASMFLPAAKCAALVFRLGINVVSFMIVKGLVVGNNNFPEELNFTRINTSRVLLILKKAEILRKNHI
ncbi:hypothetical protein [Massilia sp. DWR3-1-1]|uniref:hypothetical protein n=1 Tax=Massilia sp. DWR3-1-1 TaxID=2804559 RepID=UPI003CEECF89